MTKLTLKDIAKHFSVSVSTVSKSLHDTHEISDGFKLKIRKYAIKNHYKPVKILLVKKLLDVIKPVYSVLPTHCSLDLHVPFEIIVLFPQRGRISSLIGGFL